MLQQIKLFLIGLPGSGKSTVAAKIAEVVAQAGLAESVALSLREAVGFDFARYEDEQACLVWDAREVLSFYDETWLEAFFDQADRLVISHWTQLDLIAQSRLNQQLKRWFNGQLFYADTLSNNKATALLTLKSAGYRLFSHADAQLIPLRLTMGRVVLDHLLFILEMVQQNYQRPIWRANGLLLTQEYANPVVVDMTHSQLRTGGGSLEQLDELGAGLGQLEFWLDQSFDQAQLQEWLVASLAPGERIGI
ncbi:hypothetical protein THIAE_01155 [Thiomicrospira aerophila AL3]|uniref:Uncharacterized protein n=1 Tax=Thiomicrospira aerophila AL3 TaxID=717772 RepID=W0DUJ3_9GAMM|nr:hypothetical protein [Thiomicrospira aerophila]AHF00551.1 hypothetical protein THIAE_01155 [Thiomicrospira aerophila AL3]